VTVDARAKALAAQQQLVTTDPPFAVIACPGAGKTRLIVERHLSRPVPVRAGRAVTSFTRVATTEVYRRCAAADRLDLTDHPHLISTLDTFLWLHLVRPFLPAGRTWIRLESWRDAPAADATFIASKRPFHLADADFSYDPATSLWSPRPTGAARRGALPADWARQALRTRTTLTTAGYITGTELRAHASRNLANLGDRIGPMLTAKYAELVVDEAQDCSTADLHILRRLHDLGLPLILVADPDQAIYGFRGAATDALMTFATTLGRRDLIHNWRSTTAICTLAATLRADPARRIPDVAVADHHDAAHPVPVYTSADQDAITADFIGYADKLGIGTAECLVLSHGQTTLPKTYAGPANPPPAKSTSLAWAAGIITEYPSAPTRVRTRARDILHRTVLRWWYADADRLTATETLTANDIDPADFERLVHRITYALPSLDQPMSTWVSAAATTLTAHPPANAAARSGTKLPCTAKQRLQSARSVAGLPSGAAAGARPRLSTVHQAKGDEANAVLIIMPARADTNATITAWLSGTTTDPDVAEALRVIYVAITRARRLVGLAVPAADRDRVLAHLHQHGVGTELR